MDNATMISALQGRISILTSQIFAIQQELDADNALLLLAQTGYQSDQDAITQGISDGVSAVLAPVNASVSDALAKIASPAQPAPVTTQHENTSTPSNQQ